MRAHKSAADSVSGQPRIGRRGILAGIGAGGLASAASVFGFATPALAVGKVKRGCCTLCCVPSQTLAYCESQSHYVWTCSTTTGKTCSCCESGAPCLRKNGCTTTHFSAYKCVATTTAADQ